MKNVCLLIAIITLHACESSEEDPNIVQAAEMARVGKGAQAGEMARWYISPANSGFVA